MTVFSAVLIRATNLFAKSLVILLIARMILSWVYPNMRNTLVFWIWRLTEPFLQPIRRVLPAGGRYDWSPAVALFLVFFLREILIGIFYTLR